MITAIDHEDLQCDYFWKFFNSMNYCKEGDGSIDRQIFDQLRPALLQIRYPQAADLTGRP